MKSDADGVEMENVIILLLHESQQEYPVGWIVVRRGRLQESRPSIYNRLLRRTSGPGGFVSCLSAVAR